MKIQTFDLMHIKLRIYCTTKSIALEIIDEVLYDISCYQHEYSTTVYQDFQLNDINIKHICIFKNFFIL